MIHARTYWRLVLTAAAACLVSVAVGGCTSGKATVLTAPTPGLRPSSITLREGTFTVPDVSEENRGKLRAAIASRLYKGGAYTEGPELVITYAVIQYDKGSRSARYWSSGLGGSGSLTLEGLYSDAVGRTLAKVHFEGKISGGAFGGDFSGAIDAVAGQVAAYTRANFAPASQPGAARSVSR